MMTWDELMGHVAALENICRFNGHVNRFYSVAEHTVIGLEMMARDGVDVRFQRAFAIHDLPEAMMGLGDLARDVKKDCAVAAVVAPREAQAFEMIANCLHDPKLLRDVHSAVVKAYDRKMAVAEVEVVAHCAHDRPDDYDPKTHGYAARRIRERRTSFDLHDWFGKLFEVA